jgi:hypothetical protein
MNLSANSNATIGRSAPHRNQGLSLRSALAAFAAPGLRDRIDDTDQLSFAVGGNDATPTMRAVAAGIRSR